AAAGHRPRTRFLLHLRLLRLRLECIGDHVHAVVATVGVSGYALTSASHADTHAIPVLSAQCGIAALVALLPLAHTRALHADFEAVHHRVHATHTLRHLDGATQFRGRSNAPGELDHARRDAGDFDRAARRRLVLEQCVDHPVFQRRVLTRPLRATRPAAC